MVAISVIFIPGFKSLIKYDSGIEAIIISLIIIFTVVLSFIILIIIIIAIYCVFKAKKDKKKFLNKYKKDIEFIEMERKETKGIDIKIKTKLFEIDFKKIKFIKRIGSGAFGDVIKCKWNENFVALKLIIFRGQNKNFS